MNTSQILGVLSSTVTLGAAMAQTASFLPLGSAPGGRPPIQSQAWSVSLDGSIATGWTSANIDGDDVIVAFRADTSAGVPTLLDLSGVDIFDASGDGSVIVGPTFEEDPRDPGNFGLIGYRYSDAGGKELILSPVLDTFSTAAAVSADGTTVVGMVNFIRTFPDGLESSNAYIHTPDGGLQILSDLFDAGDRYEAFDVDADGSHVVGFADDFLGRRKAVVWETDELTPQIIPEVPGNLDKMIATAISRNGRYVAGFSLTFLDPGGNFREDAWIFDRQTNEIELLGETPSGFFTAVPAAITDDGVVVGTFNSTFFFDLPEGAGFIWSSQDGLRFLDDAVADDYGLTVPEWDLVAVRDVTPDGSTIVGYARNTIDTHMEGYVLRLGVAPPCPADLTGSGGSGEPDGVVDANDFFFYLGLFAAGDRRADLPTSPGDVPDGVIDANDFFAYLNLFAAGCP